MSSVVLQPSRTGTPGGEHPVQDLKKFLSSADQAQLGKAVPEERVVAYGKADPDASRWDRVKMGDTVLFYHRRAYFASGRVALKVQNRDLARHLWGSAAKSDQGFHDRLLLFSDLRPLNLPAKILNPIVGFSKDYILYRFQVMTAQQPTRLRTVLKDRRYCSEAAQRASTDLAFVQDIDSVVEGQERLIEHLRRERSRKLIVAKRADALRRTGRLVCEACGFNARRAYRWLEQDFAEIHHRKPLSSSTGPHDTSLADLAVLCANCHRMIHRTVPMMSVSQFRRALGRRA